MAEPLADPRGGAEGAGARRKRPWHEGQEERSLSITPWGTRALCQLQGGRKRRTLPRPVPPSGVSEPAPALGRAGGFAKNANEAPINGRAKHRPEDTSLSKGRSRQPLMSQEAWLQVRGHGRVIRSRAKALVTGSKPPVPAADRHGANRGGPIPTKVDVAIRGGKATRAIGVPLLLSRKRLHPKLGEGARKGGSGHAPMSESPNLALNTGPMDREVRRGIGPQGN